MKFQVVYRANSVKIYIVHSGEIDQFREYENVNSIDEAQQLFSQLKGYFSDIDVEFLIYHEPREYVINSQFSSYSKLRKFFKTLMVGNYFDYEFKENTNVQYSSEMSELQQ